MATTTTDATSTQNPLVWVAEVNGPMIDLRAMPREAQEIAFAKGDDPLRPCRPGVSITKRIGTRSACTRRHWRPRHLREIGDALCGSPW